MTSSGCHGPWVPTYGTTRAIYCNARFFRALLWHQVNVSFINGQIIHNRQPFLRWTLERLKFPKIVVNTLMLGAHRSPLPLPQTRIEAIWI